LATCATRSAPLSCISSIFFALPTKTPTSETTADAPSRALERSAVLEDVMSAEAGGRIWLPSGLRRSYTAASVPGILDDDSGGRVSG
jgi:hypothetical protein